MYACVIVYKRKIQVLYYEYLLNYSMKFKNYATSLLFIRRYYIFNFLMLHHFVDYLIILSYLKCRPLNTFDRNYWRKLNDTKIFDYFIS